MSRRRKYWYWWYRSRDDDWAIFTFFLSFSWVWEPIRPSFVLWNSLRITESSRLIRTHVGGYINEWKRGNCSSTLKNEGLYSFSPLCRWLQLPPPLTKVFHLFLSLQRKREQWENRQLSCQKGRKKKGGLRKKGCQTTGKKGILLQRLQEKFCQAGRKSRQKKKISSFLSFSLSNPTNQRKETNDTRLC